MAAEQGRRALRSLVLFRPPTDLLGIPLAAVQAGALPVRCPPLRFPAPALPRTGGQIDKFCPLPRTSGTNLKALTRRPGAESKGTAPGLGPAAALVRPDPVRVPFALRPRLTRGQRVRYFSS